VGGELQLLVNLRYGPAHEGTAPGLARSAARLGIRLTGVGSQDRAEWWNRVRQITIDAVCTHIDELVR